MKAVDKLRALTEAARSGPLSERWRADVRWNKIARGLLLPAFEELERLHLATVEWQCDAERLAHDCSAAPIVGCMDACAVLAQLEEALT